MPSKPPTASRKPSASRKASASKGKPSSASKKKSASGKKRTPSSYLLFSMAFRKSDEAVKLAKEGKYTAIVKRAGEKWRALSAGEKAEWKKKADALK